MEIIWYNQEIKKTQNKIIKSKKKAVFSQIICDSRFISVLFANKTYYTFLVFYSEFRFGNVKKMNKCELFTDLSHIYDCGNGLIKN